MKTIAILFALIWSPLARSDFKTEIYVSMPMGFSSMSETATGNPEHSSSFDFGVLGGTRLGLFTEALQFGFVGEYGWLGYSMDRRGDSISSVGYRFEVKRLLGGAFIGIPFGGDAFRLQAEYYPSITSTTSYSDEKSENPFRKNDVLKGNGYGAGFGYTNSSGLNITALFRQLEYSKVDLNGVPTELPGSTYGRLKNQEILGSVGFRF